MEISDKLIRRCSKKNQDAIKVLYDKIYSDLMGICMRYQKTTEDAEEAHQDSFIKIVTNLKKRKSEINFMAWAKRITINTNIDRLRKDNSNRYDTSINTSDTHVVHFSSNLLNEKIDADYLLNIINSLDFVPKQVFNLFAIDGYSHKEIAEILKIAESTSRGFLFQARKEIQFKLKKKEANSLTYKYQEA